MAAAIECPSEAEILSNVLDVNEPTLGREHAQWLLTLKFTDQQRSRIVELADKGNRGELTEQEHVELDRYRRIGMLINLLQAKAHLSLRRGDES